MKIFLAVLRLVLGVMIFMGFPVLPSYADVVYPDNFIAGNGGVGTLIGNGYLGLYTGNVLSADFDVPPNTGGGIEPEIIPIPPPDSLPVPTDFTFNVSSTFLADIAPDVTDTSAVTPENMGFESDQSTPSSVARIPEPSTILLLGSGLVGLFGYGRKRMRK